MKKITAFLFSLACFMSLGALADEPTYVAMIEDQGFETLQAALNDAQDGETVTLIADTTESVLSYRDITLHINEGVTLTGNVYYYTIFNGGTLTIEGEGTIKAGGEIPSGQLYIALYNSGTMYVTGCTIESANHVIYENSAKKTAVSGGKFSKTPGPWLASGYTTSKTADGLYYLVIALDYVAKIDSTNYETLQAALDKVKEGEIIELLCSTTEEISFDKDFVVAIKNNTYNYGTISGAMGLWERWDGQYSNVAKYVVISKSMEELVEHVTDNIAKYPGKHGRFYIYDDWTLSKDVTIPTVNDLSQSIFPIKDEFVLDLNGFTLDQAPVERSHGGYPTIVAGKGCNVTIKDSSEEQTGVLCGIGWAIDIYDNPNTCVTLESGTITTHGKVSTSVETMRGCVVRLMGGKFVMNGGAISLAQLGEGNRMFGVIITTLTSGYASVPTIEINGGSVQCATEEQLWDPDGSREPNCLVLEAKIDNESKPEGEPKQQLPLITVSGGSFSLNPPAKYIADGCVVLADKETGLYTVKEAVAKIVDGEETYYYATLQDAMDDTVDGDTVILLKDIEVKTNPGISVNGSTDATLDLNGHEIHGYAYANTTSYVIYNMGVLTIKDSSEAKTGAIIAEATDPDMKSVPGYANNAITNYGHLTLDGVYVYAAGTGSACYAVDNDAENAQWRTTCDKDAETKIVYLKIINGAKLRTAASSTVRQYLDSDEIWWNVVEMDGADMGSFWLQDNYQKTTGKGYYARAILSIKNSSFIYAVNLGYWNVAGYVDVTLENSSFTSVYNNLGQYFINGYPGKVSVKGCRFQYNFAMKQPVKCLTDGLYGNAPVDDVIVEGYEVADNEDPETKATYPHIVRPIPVVELTVTENDVPIKVQEAVLSDLVGDEVLEDLNSEDPEVREAAEQAVSEKLHTAEANGLEVWQNYVLGINGATENLSVKTEDNSATKIEIVPATDPAPNSGFTVSYKMDYTDTAATTTTLETLDIDLSGEDDPTGVYQVKAILTPDNGGESIVIETENKVGVVKAIQEMELAIVSVPWKKLSLSAESEDIPVADLVKTSTLDEGDMLLVYNGENYDAWKLDAEKTWSSVGIIVKTENGMELVASPDPTKTTVKRGSGVFLKRQDHTKPYYLYGQVDESEVVEALPDKVNLVANPNMTDFDLNKEGAISAAEGDTIIVPTVAAPKKCTKLGGKWGYQEHYIDQRGIVRERRVDEVKIPAGTGFWYEKGNKSSSSKINWTK